MKAANAAPPQIALTATMAPPPKLARTIASTHQAPASSMAPADRDSEPIGVPLSPRSWMIRASMGKAVMEMAAPMNSMACQVTIPSPNRPISISHGVSATATRKGAAIPATETAAALLAAVLK